MSQPSTTLRTPQQQRSRRSLERIIEALEELIELKTFEEITVVEVCRRAGVAVGTFYDRVGNKESLLDHLRQRFYADLITQIDDVFSPERFESMGLTEVLHIHAREMVALHRLRQGAIRAIIVEARRSAAFGAHAKQLNRELMARVTATWLERRESLRGGDPDQLVRAAFLMAAGYLRESVVWGELWPGPASDAEIASHLEHMLIGFLAASAPGENS